MSRVKGLVDAPTHAGVRLRRPSMVTALDRSAKILLAGLVRSLTRRTGLALR